MTPPLKALSIMQPWAWLIVHGYKPIENRSRWTGYRGPFQVHTGRTVDTDAVEDLRAGRHPCTGEPLRLDLPEQFETGGIVGLASIVACVTRSDDGYFVGPYGYALTDAHPLPFRPCKGRLGFFVPDFSPPPAPAPLTATPLDLFTTRGLEV